MLIIQAQRNRDLDEVTAVLQELNKGDIDYFSRKRVKWLFKHFTIAIATIEGEVVGACVLNTDSPEVSEIFALAIAPNFQRQGVGTKLNRWAEAMARCHNHDAIYAESYKIYEAVGFYEGLDYHKVDSDSYWTFIKWL